MGVVVQLSPVSADSPLSDEALLVECGRGSADALGQLFERHHRSVYRFLARMIPLDHSALDDLVQNTFLSAQRTARLYKGKSAVSTWLMAVSANIVRNHIRSEKRRRKAIENYKELPASSVVSPENRVAEQQSMARLAQALDELSYKLKVVFVMCDLEGISGVEVAKTLKLREGTVWRRLHDARKKLRARLLEDEVTP